MNDWNGFQIAVVGVFAFLLMAGMAVFALYAGRSGQEAGEVTIWGTVDSNIMDALFVELVAIDDAFQNVDYVEKEEATYRQELTEAIARGAAPDLAMLDETDVIEFSGKVQTIPYAQISQRTYLDSYIDEAELFLATDGVLGMPLLIDPLVMYWNRDLFAGAGLASYPKTWTELQAIAPRMTSLDGASNVRRSAVALGTYDNVTHAREIISALLLQAGDEIVTYDQDGVLQPVFGENRAGSVENPAEAVLRFYTNFANPTQAAYSWNRALPTSFNAFAAGDVGVYFGFASEYKTLTERNPNLALGVATLPQTSASRAPLTYGRMSILAVPRGAANPVGGMIIAERMTSQVAIAIISAKTGLPGVRRDVLADTPESSAGSVFAQSALIARAWHDPSPQETRAIVKTMIESVISGRERLGDAVRTASLAFAEIFARLNLQ